MHSRAILAQLGRWSLLQQFSLLCIVALLVFGVILAQIVNAAIEENMVSRAREITASFVRSEVSAALDLANIDALPPKALEGVVAHECPTLYFGAEIARVKVWNPSGKIIWSDDPALIGKTFLDNNDLLEALSGKVVSSVSKTIEPEHERERQYTRLMEIYIPISLSQYTSIPFVVEVYQHLDPLYDDLHAQQQTVWIAMALGFAALYVALFGLVYRASVTMQRQTESLLRSKEQLIQADKLVSLGVLSAGVAHEINNPNQRILLNATVFSRAWGGILPILEKYYEENGDFSVSGMSYSRIGPKMPEAIQNIVKASERIKIIVRELSDFARREPERAMEPVDLNKVLRSAAFLTRKMVKESTDHFSMRLQKDIPPVAGNFQRLEQVFVNLIINACQALPNRGSRLNVASGYDEAKKCIAIKIRDEGSGILEKDLPRIFDPFFTTRADGGGTGLGLAISQSILNEHGATIRFRSTPNRGTTVSVLFPVIETGRKVVGAATSDSEALNERKSAVTNRQAVL